MKRPTLLLILLVLVISCAVASVALDLPSKMNDYIGERGRQTELQREFKERPAFAAGYRRGQEVGRGYSMQKTNSEFVKSLRDVEFRRSGSDQTIDWKSGFEMGFEKTSAR